MGVGSPGNPFGRRKGKSGYDTHSFCRPCGQWREKVCKHCPECGQWLRHNPRRKKTGVKRI